MNELSKSILAAANTPKSATALAQAVGKSKGYMIQDELQTLIDSGDLIADDSGKFTTYKAASRSRTVTVRNNQQNTVVVDSQISEDNRIPQGYTVSKKEVIRKSDGKKGRSITMTFDGTTKKVFVENGYSLIVINKQPVKAVKTPASAFSVIAKWAEDNGLTPFVVKDTVTGNTIGNTTSINSYLGIIDLTVSKINKAATK